MASGIVAKDRKANWTRFCNFTTHNIKFSAVGLLDHGQWNCWDIGKCSSHSNHPVGRRSSARFQETVSVPSSLTPTIFHFLFFSDRDGHWHTHQLQSLTPTFICSLHWEYSPQLPHLNNTHGYSITQSSHDVIHALPRTTKLSQTLSPQVPISHLGPTMYLWLHLKHVESIQCV